MLTPKMLVFLNEPISFKLAHAELGISILSTLVSFINVQSNAFSNRVLFSKIDDMIVELSEDSLEPIFRSNID